MKKFTALCEPFTSEAVHLQCAMLRKGGVNEDVDVRGRYGLAINPGGFGAAGKLRTSPNAQNQHTQTLQQQIKADLQQSSFSDVKVMPGVLSGAGKG